MKKIQGLTQSDVINVINTVAKNHRNKAFGPYTEEDIEQEAWLIALNKLDEFVPTRGKNNDITQCLENWLNTVVSRRLKNFYRDKYVVPQRALKSDKTEVDQVKRTNLMHPLNIDEISTHKSYNCNLILENETWKHIINRLNPDLVDILDAMLSGQYIKCYYRNKLLQAIKAIMEEECLEASH